MTGAQRLCTEHYAGTIGPCPVSSFSIPPHIPPDEVHDVGEYHTLSHHVQHIHIFTYMAMRADSASPWTPDTLTVYIIVKCVCVCKSHGEEQLHVMISTSHVMCVKFKQST